MTVERSKGDGKLPPATKKVAPDGGWAWMVCFGVSLVNVSIILVELRVLFTHLTNIKTMLEQYKK